MKLDIFHLAKLVSFDAARRIPMLRQMDQGLARRGICQVCQPFGPSEKPTPCGVVVMCFPCDEPFPLGQIPCESSRSIPCQRQGLHPALCLIGNCRASGQGHRRCLNSASLSEGSLPRNQESETPSVHEANSHPSKTVVTCQVAVPPGEGTVRGMRRRCVEHETWSCRLNSVVVDTGRKIHVTASCAIGALSLPLSVSSSLSPAVHNLLDVHHNVGLLSALVTFGAPLSPYNRWSSGGLPDLLFL